MSAIVWVPGAVEQAESICRSNQASPETCQTRPGYASPDSLARIIRFTLALANVL